MYITANATQTVVTQGNVLFTDAVICGCRSIYHRPGSGLVTLKGVTNQCRARFKITFGANVALATGATVAPTEVAIAINGEPINTTTMITTPAAVGNLWNISTETYIDVPSGCCTYLTVKNIGTTSIDVQNANLIVERVA